jgi:putative endonuclease
MSPQAAKAKKNAYSFGHFAEFTRCWYLLLSGYRIVHQGYRSASGEINIIARRGNVLTFIEVKARGNQSDATHALGPTQCRRIERTAMTFLTAHPELSNHDCRFDLMALAPLVLAPTP